MEESSKFALVFVLLFLIAVPLILAAPNQVTLQGKLTNAAGAATASTTVNATFRIYDSFVNGTQLWIQETNITTDANGVYDIILRNINLSFADQYYLGITLGSDLEAAPRINLTSSPYSFRANVSEDLNQNNSYVVRNLTVTANTTLGSGELSTLQINTLYLNLTTQDMNFSGGLGISGSSSYFTGKLGIGMIIPASKLDVIGDVSIAGPLNASSINITGNSYFATASGNVGIGTISPTYKLQIIGNVSISDNLTVDAGTLFVDSVNNRVGIGQTSPNVTLGVSGRANITGYLEVGGGLNVSNGMNVISGKVGIGTTSPNYKLDVAGTINASGLLLTNNSFSITQAGTIGVNTTNSGSTLTVAGTFNASGSGTGPGLYVNGAGNVGIGTTAPGEKLHIIGSINVSSAYLANTNGSASAPVYSYWNDTNTGGFSPTPDTLAWTTGGTERVRIDSSGKVGINTTSPAEALDVNGNIKLSSAEPLINISGPIIRKSGNDIVISD